MLSGLAAPDRGTVRLNGFPIGDIAVRARIHQVAWLRRTPVIYRGTLMENLSRFGMSPLSDVLYVARLLALEEDIAQLPSGLDTRLSGGATDPIPPGMRQRVCLTRQLAPRPRVILFDHADTGLDTRSYTAVGELFSRLRGKATLILATNDQTLRLLASQRLTLAGGSLRADAAERETLNVARYREVRV